MKLRSVLIVPMVIVACSDDPTRPAPGGQPPPLKTIDKTSALIAANANLRGMLVGSAQSSVFVDDAQLIGEVAGSIGGDCVSTPESSDCYDLSYESDATEMADHVAEKILNIANIESEESTKLVLKLIPEKICESEVNTPVEPGQPTPPPVIDQDCVAAFNANPIRLELTSRVDNDIDVGILIGEARTNPIDIQLYRSELAVELDLGAAKAAAESLLAALGDRSTDVPSTLSGRVRLSIKKNGENHYTLLFAILSAIDVVVEDVAFHAGAANPAIRVDVNGNTQALDATVGFGELRGELPLSLMFGSDAAPCPVGEVCDPPPTPVTGTVGYRLGALKWSTMFSVGSEESAVIEGIDFGNGFAMTVDDKPMLSADADLRTLEVTSDDSGMNIAVTPSLIANVSFDFRNIMEHAMDFPSWALDDDLTLELKGAAKPALKLHEMTEAIEVVAGSLMIRSRTAGRTVDVAAGMCLTASEPMEGSEAHPVELLSSGTCP